MNKNPKLLMVVAVLLLTGIFSLFIFGGGKKSEGSLSSKKSKQAIYDVASGDTNNETLHTLIAGQQKLERENKALIEENNQLTKEGLSAYEQKFEEEKRALNEQFSNEKAKLLQEIKLANKVNQATHKSKNYVLNGADEASGYADQAVGDVGDMSQSSFSVEESNAMASKKMINKMNQKPELPSHYHDSSDKDQEKQSYYTIPSNSTLARTTLMTNIIAEVPVMGKLVEPAMPFKAIIGKKDLFASNGMKLPEDLGGIVVSGYSVGNMSLSCARMYVTQVLFTFQDGSFTVYPENNKLNGSEIYPKDALGYLSDQYGNVCLTGQYITDAPKVIASLTAFGGAAGFGQYTAQSQTTTYSDADSSSTSMTGDAFKYGMGNAIGTGSDTALKWYTQRVGDIFDAVYLPKMANDGKSMRQLVFNATQTIPIDTSDKTRKLQYDNQSQNTRKVGELD